MERVVLQLQLICNLCEAPRTAFGSQKRALCPQPLPAERLPETYLPMAHSLQSEQHGAELLPSSSEFFPAGAQLPFGNGSLHREDDQAIQALIAQVKQLPDAASTGHYTSSWLHQPPPSELRAQQDAEFLALLGTQRMQQQQITAVPQAAQPTMLDARLSSTDSTKVLSLPIHDQQLSLAVVGAASFHSGRPGELSPVPEQHNISPAPASEAAADDKQRTRRHLFKSLSQQQHRTLSSSDGRQLSVLLLPGVTCEAATTAATAVPGQQLQTHSVPSSPIQGNLTLVTRSLSLQRASAQPAVVPLQQALYSHEYLKQQNDSGNHPAPAAAAAKSSSGVTQQQQHLWQGDVGSSSLRVSRDSNRELVRQTDSMRGSEANQAELLQLQAQVVRLHEGQRELQDRLLSADQQLSECQELLARRQEEVLAARADLAAADKGKQTAREQIEHLEAKVRATESQLEFAHKQLDVRQQELRGAADASTAAKRSGEQLAAEVETLKEELTASRREIDAVNKRLALEATESRRAADEAAAVRRGLASLQNELNKSRQETLDARERLRQEVTDSDRRMAQADLQMNDMAQQIKLLKERTSAMQTANDRLHNQLVSAESDNATLRNDVASLLGAQQELVDSRENMRQLQLDATRRIGQLESDISGLSQQLMFTKSQNDRLNQQLSSAGAENTALHADFDNAHAAANSANRALHDTQLQHEHNMQQYKQQIRQQQSLIQQLQQQLDRAAAAAAVPSQVLRFGIGSNSSMNPYQGGDPLRSSRRLDFADTVTGSAGPGLGGLGPGAPGAALGPSPSMYDIGNPDSSRFDRYQPAVPAAVDSYGSYSSYSLAPVDAGTSSNSPQQVWRSSPARGGAGSSDTSRYNSTTAMPPPLSGDKSRARLGFNGPADDPGVGFAASNTTAVAVGGPRVVWQSPEQQVQQQGQAVAAVQANDAPWFAGGSRASTSRTTRPAAAAAQPFQQPQQQQQQPLSGGHPAGVDHLAAEPSQRWQPQQQQQQQQQSQSVWHYQQQQQPQQQLPGPAVVPRSSSPVRQAAPTMSEQQQHLKAAAGGAVPTPFGTAMTVAEIMARTQELEDLLLACCQEKDDLNKELSKMSLGAGKTLKERQRKQYVEQRLQELDLSISKTRMQLKKLVGR